MDGSRISKIETERLRSININGTQIFIVKVDGLKISKGLKLTTKRSSIFTPLTVHFDPIQYIQECHFFFHDSCDMNHIRPVLLSTFMTSQFR